MISNYYAENSKLTRSSQMKKYDEFCNEYEGCIVPYPCDSDQVCLYITYMSKTLKYVSIKNYVSALNDSLRSLGFPAIDYTNYNVKRCLTGAKRMLGDSQKQAKPLLPSHLLAISRTLSASAGHTSFRAALLTAFRGLLRKAHVTESDATIRRKDISFHKWGMLVMIFKSKTIQFAERSLEIPISYSHCTDLCPVYWTQRHFSEIRANPEDLAFRIPTSTGSKPLTYKLYEDTLKYMCETVGLDPRDYSSHSLRRGGSTFLHMAGASITEIKKRGDWSSDCVYQYLVEPLSARIRDDMTISAMISNWLD